MIATLRFRLPEEAREHMTAVKAASLVCVICDVARELEQARDELSESRERMAFETALHLLRKALRDNDVTDVVEV